MKLKQTVICVLMAAAVAGCETVDTVPVAGSERPAAATVKAKTLVGKARMASARVPETCETFTMDTLRSGGATRVQTGCAVKAGDAMVIVGLNESTIPFDEAFSVSGGGAGNFQQVAAVYPRETLSDFVMKNEKYALASAEQGWRYSNKRTKLLPENGGVKGASACVQFSFDATSTTSPPKKSRSSGVRCARFGKSAETIQEVMVEVMSFYPANQKAPGAHRAIAEGAIRSLQYR